MRHRLACLMALSATASPAARAQDVLRLPVYGAVEAGMGLTLSAATGAAALFATPVGMAARAPEAALTVLRWNDGRPITLGALAATRPIGRGGGVRPVVGVFATGFVRGDDAGEAGSASEIAAGAALSIGAGPLRVGVAARGVRVAFDDAVFSGLTVDAGAQGTFAAGDLVVGGALRHAGPALSGPGDLRADLPGEVRAGASWRALSVRAADGGAPIARLRVAADLASATGDATRQTFHAGAEVVAFDQFSGRIGRVTALGDTPDALSRWTFGLGYRQGRLHADAAVLPSPEGTDPSVSFTLRTAL